MPSLCDMPSEVLDRTLAFLRKRVAIVHSEPCYHRSTLPCCPEHDALDPRSESCRLRVALACVCERLAKSVRDVPCYRVRNGAKVPVSAVRYCKGLHVTYGSTSAGFKPEILVCDPSLLEKDVLTDNVLEMYAIGDVFAGQDNLPSSVRHLSLQCGSLHGPNVLNLRCSNILELTLGDHFDGPLDGLPENLRKLRLGCNFNQPINALPSTLSHLWLGVSFDQPIAPGVLPARLVELDLGFVYNHPLPPLPPTLRSLRLSETFNHQVEPGSLPAALVFLEFGAEFDHKLPVLPPQLQYLRLSEHFSHPLLLPELPASLVCLVCGFRVTRRDHWGRWGMWVDSF